MQSLRHLGEGSEQGIRLGGGANADTDIAIEQRGAVMAHQHTAPFERELEFAGIAPFNPAEDKVGGAGEGGEEGEGLQTGKEPFAFGDDGLDALVQFGDRFKRSDGGGLGSHRDVIRLLNLPELLDQPAGKRP